MDKCEGESYKNISLHSSKFDKSQNSSPNLRMLEFNLKDITNIKERNKHSFNILLLNILILNKQKADPNKESAGGTTIIVWRDQAMVWVCTIRTIP